MSPTLKKRFVVQQCSLSPFVTWKPKLFCSSDGYVKLSQNGGMLYKTTSWNCNKGRKSLTGFLGSYVTVFWYDFTDGCPWHICTSQYNQQIWVILRNWFSIRILAGFKCNLPTELTDLKNQNIIIYILETGLNLSCLGCWKEVTLRWKRPTL